MQMRDQWGMSNVLTVSLQTTIYSLHDRGWSPAALKLAGARLFIREASITERRHQFQTPQDASARNFIPQCDFTRYCKT
jgi:hypothetical protein